MALVDTHPGSSSVPADLLKSVVDYFKPRQVILFGSHARGDATPDSDIDLLVVLDDDAPREHLSSRAAYEARRACRRACDIVPWRKSDFLRRAGVIGSLPHTVFMEGRVIYGEQLDRSEAARMTADNADLLAQWEEARRWVRVADEDLRTVELCLRGDPPATATAAYHCQQAAEKLLKALLVASAHPIRKTHDLDELADCASEAHPRLVPLAEPCRVMTRWGFAFRYPASADGFDPTPPTEDEIVRARAVLTELRSAVAALEPGAREGNAGRTC